jgi:hypothetical protein
VVIKFARRQGSLPWRDGHSWVRAPVRAAAAGSGDADAPGSGAGPQAEETEGRLGQRPSRA